MKMLDTSARQDLDPINTSVTPNGNDMLGTFAQSFHVWSFRS
jgi:hypothetical protein